MTPLGSFKYVLEGLGTHQVDALGCRVRVEEVDQGEPPQTEISKWTAFFDRDRLADPLLLRDVQPGDRFVPLGMKGHKKLKDFFIDLKLPLEARRRVPLLISRNEIVWVCGLRMDDRFKVTSETRNILRVEFMGLTFGSGP
jgi:tRNA(Ile)-lysidine synthase